MSKALKYQAVSAALLRKLGACKDQIAVFRVTFGDGDTPITPEMITRAYCAGLDLDWAAEYLLTAPAWKAYKAAMAQAWEAYEAAKAPAREAYEAAMAQTWKAYEAATAQAQEAYEAATAPAREAYEAAMAQALIKTIFPEGA